MHYTAVGNQDMNNTFREQIKSLGLAEINRQTLSYMSSAPQKDVSNAKHVCDISGLKSNFLDFIGIIYTIAGKWQYNFSLYYRCHPSGQTL